MNQDDLLKTLLDARLRLCAGLWPVLPDAHTVEDIYQMTLVRAVHDADKLRDAEHAVAWARVTARNLAIDHIRKHRSRVAVLDEGVIELLEAELDRRGDEALVAKINALKHCVEKLPRRSRNLVNLRYDENRDGRSIAEQLGVSLDALYQAMRRVHVALRGCVEKQLKTS